MLIVRHPHTNLTVREETQAIFIGDATDDGFTIKKNRYGKTGTVATQDEFLAELVKTLNRNHGWE